MNNPYLIKEISRTMNCDMDMDIDILYSPTIQNIDQLVFEAASSSKLKKSPEWILMEKTNRSQYKSYYSYLLLETPKIFPNIETIQKPGPTKLLMLEAPKENSQIPIQAPSQKNEDDNCKYKRKCQFTSYPIKLIKYSKPLKSY